VSQLGFYPPFKNRISIKLTSVREDRGRLIYDELVVKKRHAK